MNPTEETYDELRQQIAELRTELNLISGGWEARVENRRQLRDELENVRGQLGLLRGELGIVKEQRNHLRSQLAETRDQLESAEARRERLIKLAHGIRERRDKVIKQLAETRGELESARDALGDARARLRKNAGNKMRVDGTLLYDLITQACPAVLTDEAVHHIARTTVDELDRVGPGVEVFRQGDPDQPWTRRDTPDAVVRPFEAATFSVPYRVDTAGAPAARNEASSTDDEVRYAVFTGPRPGDEPFLVAEGDNLADAQLTAEHLPGSWVGRQLLKGQGWEPVS